MKRIAATIHRLLFYNRKQTIERILSKDYYARLLIQEWLQADDELSNYDNLIIQFLETLPETVSVKTTLENTLVICLEFRRTHIHDTARASRACAFARSLRKFLKFWEPDTLAIPATEAKRTCLVESVMDFHTLNISTERFLVIQLPPGIKKIEVDHYLIFGFDHSEKLPKLWTQHLPDLYNEPVGLITIDEENNFTISQCSNNENKQHNSLTTSFLQLLKDCCLKPATYAVLRALLLSFFITPEPIYF